MLLAVGLFDCKGFTSIVVKQIMLPSWTKLLGNWNKIYHPPFLLSSVDFIVNKYGASSVSCMR